MSFKEEMIDSFEEGRQNRVYSDGNDLEVKAFIDSDLMIVSKRGF